MPRDHHVAALIVRHVHHVLCLHSGTEYVLSMLRREYWIERVRPLIRRLIKECKTCTRLNAKPKAPRMADLPPERLASHTRPFTYTGIDVFGPFMVKRGRSQVKRYGLVFTCLTIRAIHLEVLPSLTTDAFINALRRFVARRGKPERLFSDNGTNFIGAYRELGDALRQLDDRRKIQGFLLQTGICWSFNPPASSHMVEYGKG